MFQKSKPAASWQKSVGSLNSKPGISGLVRVNKSANDTIVTSKKEVAVAKQSTEVSPPKVEGNIPPAVAQSSLSLLGSYSGSDSD